MLQIGTGGGFVPQEIRFGEWPSYNLYADGTLITQGPQIEIYPPPALPAMTHQRISPDGVQQLLEAAADAGLTDGDASYENALVADAPTTTIVVTEDGSTSTTQVYALGFPPGDQDSLPADQREELAKIETFVNQATSPTTFLPEGSVGPEEAFTPTGLVLTVWPYGQAPDPNLEQPAQPWPLEAPLAAFGEPIVESDMRCGVVTGEDLSAVWAAAEGANTLTPWTSDGDDFTVVFRPLLPHETGCPQQS